MALYKFPGMHGSFTLCFLSVYIMPLNTGKGFFFCQTEVLWLWPLPLSVSRVLRVFLLFYSLITGSCRLSDISFACPCRPGSSEAGLRSDGDLASEGAVNSCLEFPPLFCLFSSGFVREKKKKQLPSLQTSTQLNIVAHTYNPRTQEAEAGDSQVQRQPGLHVETFSPKQNKSYIQKKCNENSPSVPASATHSLERHWE